MSLTKLKEKKIKSYIRWIEVSDYSLAPRTHGEYSNKEDRIRCKAIQVRITPLKGRKISKIKKK